jgi:HECT-domain (ubiquitin-transferase)
VLSLDFSTMEEAGQCKQKGRERYEVVDLIPNGRDILVTDANKKEFMRVSSSRQSYCKLYYTLCAT